MRLFRRRVWPPIIPDHQVAMPPARLVEPGMVTLYGVVAGVSNGGDGRLALLFCHNTAIYAAADDPIIVLGRVGPEVMLDVHRIASAARAAGLAGDVAR
jgi:hypothetical protein